MKLQHINANQFYLSVEIYDIKIKTNYSSPDSFDEISFTAQINDFTYTVKEKNHLGKFTFKIDRIGDNNITQIISYINKYLSPIVGLGSEFYSGERTSKDYFLLYYRDFKHFFIATPLYALKHTQESAETFLTWEQYSLKKDYVDHELSFQNVLTKKAKGYPFEMIEIESANKNKTHYMVDKNRFHALIEILDIETVDSLETIKLKELQRKAAEKGLRYHGRAEQIEYAYHTSFVYIEHLPQGNFTSSSKFIVGSNEVNEGEVVLFNSGAKKKEFDFSLREKHFKHSIINAFITLSPEFIFNPMNADKYVLVKLFKTKHTFVITVQEMINYVYKNRYGGYKNNVISHEELGTYGYYKENHDFKIVPFTFELKSPTLLQKVSFFFTRMWSKLTLR